MSSSAAQSHLRFPLTRLLGNGGSIRVLRAMMSYGGPLSVVQLARDTGLTRQGVRLVLNGLEAQGLVTAHGVPRSQLFSVVTGHPFATPLMAMFEQERARWAALNQTLREALQANPQVTSAWLYGSVARGEDAPHSDIDIAIVTQDDSLGVAEAVRETLQALEERWGVHVSIVALAPTDVARLQPNDSWWLEVTKDAKVLKGVGPQQEALRCARAVHPA